MVRALRVASRARKYKNEWTEVDGLKFQSKAEAKRYGELRLLLKADEISDLTLQPKIRCVVNGVHVCDYFGDFAYTDRRTFKRIHEDVKGMKTPIYKLKKKLVLACSGIEIKEV